MFGLFTKVTKVYEIVDEVGTSIGYVNDFLTAENEKEKLDNLAKSCGFKKAYRIICRVW